MSLQILIFEVVFRLFRLSTFCESRDKVCALIGVSPWPYQSPGLACLYGSKDTPIVTRILISHDNGEPIRRCDCPITQWYALVSKGGLWLRLSRLHLFSPPVLSLWRYQGKLLCYISTSLLSFLSSSSSCLRKICWNSLFHLLWNIPSLYICPALSLKFCNWRTLITVISTNLHIFLSTE